MSHAYKVFLATAYPPPDLVKTMKRFLACLALCTSLSASAQEDCTTFNLQELAAEILELQDSIAGLNSDLDNCGANLSNAGLNGADLVGADLSRADLSSADFTDANPFGANLSGADLSEAFLYGADLTGATMTCLYGCPSALPSGYTCEPDPDCSEPDRYRIVPG